MRRTQKKLAFTERQASAILEMRLYKLIGLEILALEKEHRETLRKIGEYKKILGSRAQMNRVIKEDLAAIKAEFATPGAPLIEDGPEAVYDESAVAVQEMVFVMDRFDTASCWISPPMTGTRKPWTPSRSTW